MFLVDNYVQDASNLDGVTKKSKIVIRENMKNDSFQHQIIERINGIGFVNVMEKVIPIFNRKSVCDLISDEERCACGVMLIFGSISF